MYHTFLIRSKLAIPNKRFIHSPAEKKPEFYDKSLAVSENQIKVSRSGIIDKTEMNEAVDNLGMKCAIWVKYRVSPFHNNYNNKYCIAKIINKAENLVIHGTNKKITKKKK